MKRTGRPPPGAKNVQRWTGRRWIADDGKTGQAFIGRNERERPMAWAVDADDEGDQPLMDRARDHCCATFSSVNSATLPPSNDKRAAVAVLINEDGHVLSIARKNNDKHFGLPGGKREYGESAESAALRELHEETGVGARKDQVRHLYQGVDAEGWTVDAYLVYDWQGEPAPREGQEVRWTPWSGLYGPPWGQYNRAVEKALKEDRRRVLKVAEGYINEARGCQLVDVAIHVGQEVHPHGRLSTLVAELIDRGRIYSVDYQTPGMRRPVPGLKYQPGLKKYQVVQKFLLPKGSVLL